MNPKVVCAYVSYSIQYNVYSFVLQDKLLAGNALEFLGLKREQFE